MKQDRFKFRFFIEHNNFYPKIEGIMLYEDFFVKSDGQVSFGGSDNNYSRGILMQSTDFKDKNGKLIYEGDILASNTILLPFRKIKYQVYYNINEKRFFIRSLLSENTNVPLSMLNLEKTEIIGNIYENKNLIKE